jgi:hypothetical protein
MGVRDMRRFIRYIQEMQAAFLGLGLCFSPAFVRASDTTSIQEVMVERNWQEVKMGPGKCSMKFPNQPEHVSETMQMEGVEFSLQYDAFIASSDTKAIFMLLVAQYPDFVDEQFAHASLEAFLNGILTHNPNNQLLFADLVLVSGYEALDFFIRSGGVYFKGRALMVKNQLYLMAMECEVQHYDENHYNTFVNSFLLGNP